MMLQRQGLRRLPSDKQAHPCPCKAQLIGSGRVSVARLGAKTVPTCYSGAYAVRARQQRPSRQMLRVAAEAPAQASGSAYAFAEPHRLVMKAGDKEVSRSKHSVAAA